MPPVHVRERSAPSTTSGPAHVTLRGRVLGNGRYRTLITTSGTGGAWLGDEALTAWRGDRIEDGDGWFVYVRDVTDGRFWSIGDRPVPAAPERYEVEDGPGWIAFTRRDHGIESRMEVWVDADLAVECRSITLRNLSDRVRTLDVTGYLEVVLHDPRHHAAHPGFSKLFVQTEFLAIEETLMARRRPRGVDERHPWLVHAARGPGLLSHETDRGRFLGRGRGPDAPLALVTSVPLSGATGDVLDPALALRRTVELAPGATARVDMMLGAGSDRDQALAIARRLSGAGAFDGSRAGAIAQAIRRLGDHGLSAEEGERFERLAAAMLYRDPTLDRVAYDEILALPAGRMAAGDLAWLQARVALSARDGFPAPASDTPSNGRRPGDERAVTARTARTGQPPAPRPAADPGDRPPDDEPLRCFNGWGGFNARGDEYVVRMPRDASGAPRLTPQPWINVLANPSFGALISESGAGCTWSRNSREFRLTPWSNDPVRDPHDEALYLRDEESGLLWSAFPGPVPGDGPYEMRHGFGYSRCRHASAGLEVESEVFVHESDPVKIVQVRITNPGDRARRLSVTAYQRLVLGPDPVRAAPGVSTWADATEGILFARDAGSMDFPDAVVFAASVAPGGAGPVASGTDRSRFLGPGGSPSRPAALLSGESPGAQAGGGAEPCFWQRVPLEIGPGASVECAFLLGEGAGIEMVGALVQRLRRPGAIAAARAEVVGAWQERLGRVRIETPVEALDLMANGWLAYQTLACRLWARTAFYQSGGAFGFRDQLQDAAAFLATEPQITRDQILLHCAHQFVEGDVLHWWHPPGGRGIRTRFADDLLWLPFVTAAYVRTTGDLGLLDERVAFIEARPLGPGEDEALLTPEATGGLADVYEHCGRAIDRSLGTGAHGLPLFGSGDWNDGMNRVGRAGRGESVWMAFFLHQVIADFAPLCERRGDTARAARWRAHQGVLREALERSGWDGEWYRRGYYDDGAPLGSRASDECRIDALVQAWSVLSGAAPRARSEQAMDALERELISWDAGLVRLLWPPFDRTAHDPGYIKGYLPGVRENGGQYTHAALWVVAAMAALGRREPAARLLALLSPVTRAGSPAAAGVYQVEPYVVAADVYGNPQHLGRGGWSWYTGSAGWMLRITIECVLGVTVEGGDTLVVRAAIPPGWPGFRLRLRPLGRSGTYALEVRSRSAAAAEVVAVTVDGRAIPPRDGVARIPLADDGIDHVVEIELE